MKTRTAYTTYNEAIEREIIEPIEASGVVENAREAFYIAMIAEDYLAYVEGWDKERGAYNVTRCGYIVREDVEFWDIVAKYER